jgi:hypothetical protein
MKIPTTLKHKPVVVSENYENVGGRYAYNSDAKGLSLGLAQWNDRGKVKYLEGMASHTGEMVPSIRGTSIHRILDLAIMVCRTKVILWMPKNLKTFMMKRIRK